MRHEVKTWTRNGLRQRGLRQTRLQDQCRQAQIINFCIFFKLENIIQIKSPKCSRLNPPLSGP